MPVKWTSETDQILLLKILETSDVSPKCAEISQKWPTGLDRPTPRAISERIFKIRSMAKASGTAGHFSISSAATKSTTGTPRKNAASHAVKKSLAKKGAGGKADSGKRKRGSGEMSDEEPSDDAETDTFKSEDNGTNASDDEEAPVKKAKTNTSAANSKGKTKNKNKNKGSIKVEDEEVENKTIDDKGYENAFGGGDDGMEVLDAA